MNKEFIIKYTPNKINNFYIDNHLKNIINSNIELDNINILFFGDSGTGKSSIINAILNQYYNFNIQQEYIMNINNLKDNGVHNIRQNLKNFCQMTNTGFFKRTIIFDDIDIINEQIQQIIRHCIDKYGHKINFIGSCSNIQKVLDNIQSCMNIIKLYPINNNNLNLLLNHVLINENINLDDKSKELLIKLSQYSIRNLLNFIFKLKLYDTNDINFNTIQSMCTNISFYKFDDYIIYIKNNNFKQGYFLLNSFINSGFSVMDIYENLFNYIKITELINEKEKFLFYKILCKYIHIFYSNHEDNFELLLFTNDLCKIIN